MEHKVYISIDGEWHKLYEPKTKQDNNCFNCSLEDYCVKDVFGAPCTGHTIYKKVSEIK